MIWGYPYFRKPPYIYIYVYMYICIYMCVCVCVCVYIYICLCECDMHDVSTILIGNHCCDHLW